MQSPGKRRRDRPKRIYVDGLNEDVNVADVTEKDPRLVTSQVEKSNLLWRPRVEISRKKSIYLMHLSLKKNACVIY